VAAATPLIFLILPGATKSRDRSKPPPPEEPPEPETGSNGQRKKIEPPPKGAEPLERIRSSRDEAKDEDGGRKSWRVGRVIVRRISTWMGE